MEETKLYLVFEFLTMDLLQYIDQKLAHEETIHPLLVKSYVYQVRNIVKGNLIVRCLLVTTRSYVLSSEKNHSQRSQAC